MWFVASASPFVPAYQRLPRRFQRPCLASFRFITNHPPAPLPIALLARCRMNVAQPTTQPPGLQPCMPHPRERMRVLPLQHAAPPLPPLELDPQFCPSPDIPFHMPPTPSALSNRYLSPPPSSLIPLYCCPLDLNLLYAAAGAAPHGAPGCAPPAPAPQDPLAKARSLMARMSLPLHDS